MNNTVNGKNLLQMGFSKHEINYEGCPDHLANDGWGCPVDNSGNCLCKSGKAPYWSIDGEHISLFTKKFKSESDFISYIFVEEDGSCRKIGEGKVERVRANLKAHYNHGLTKSPHTLRDRSANNSIAKRCRSNRKSYVFVKSATSKDEAKAYESKLKSLYAGWLDYDQM